MQATWSGFPRGFPKGKAESAQATVRRRDSKSASERRVRAGGYGACRTAHAAPGDQVDRGGNLGTRCGYDTRHSVISPRDIRLSARVSPHTQHGGVAAPYSVWRTAPRAVRTGTQDCGLLRFLLSISDGIALDALNSTARFDVARSSTRQTK